MIRTHKSTVKAITAPMRALSKASNGGAWKKWGRCRQYNTGRMCGEDASPWVSSGSDHSRKEDVQFMQTNLHHHACTITPQAHSSNYREYKSRITSLQTWAPSPYQSERASVNDRRMNGSESMHVKAAYPSTPSLQPNHKICPTCAWVYATPTKKDIS